jgi:hypothetical protein
MIMTARSLLLLLLLPVVLLLVGWAEVAKPAKPIPAQVQLVQKLAAAQLQLLQAALAVAAKTLLPGLWRQLWRQQQPLLLLMMMLMRAPAVTGQQIGVTTAHLSRTYLQQQQQLVSLTCTGTVLKMRVRRMRHQTARSSSSCCCSSSSSSSHASRGTAGWPPQQQGQDGTHTTQLTWEPLSQARQMAANWPQQQQQQGLLQMLQVDVAAALRCAVGRVCPGKPATLWQPPTVLLQLLLLLPLAVTPVAPRSSRHRSPWTLRSRIEERRRRYKPL